MHTPFIDVQHVTKRYASKVAVEGVSLQIPHGSVFGLLGPNGAGKTSLIRMLAVITRPDAGRIIFNGEPLAEGHQRQMGYMPEERGLYRKMRVREQAIYLVMLKGLPKKAASATVDAWLERFELTPWANNKVADLSKGMQQKVQFIATVAHQPPFLILDEPFSGLDPMNANLLEGIIRELSQQGTTILFSTHRMEQVEEFCNHIALINDGTLLLNEETRALRTRFRKPVYRFETPTAWDASLLPTDWTVLQRTALDARVQVPANVPRPDVLRELAQRFELVRFEHETPSIRDIFIETVREARPATPIEPKLISAT
jgi:ABC-2 type transport system ATP-binding protein